MDYNLKYDEKAVFALRALYGTYGYTQYKMNKFEEYDLYVRNKDFLISDAVITFTDTNGKLMAMKPDVTFSIIKDSDDKSSGVQKLYYNENVYRVSQHTGSFKEIMQVGLECIGDVDAYCIYEVLMLAAKSLKTMSESFVLDISHMGIIAAIIDGLDISKNQSSQLLKSIESKNVHELEALCTRFQIDTNSEQVLKQLILNYGAPKEVLPKLEAILKDTPAYEAFLEFQTILSAAQGSEIENMLRIDFSVINDIKYYNGFIFKGFIEGIPASVLSGGQYDKLMQKMKRKSGAIGFAVYLDMLERYEKPQKGYDVDTVLIYDESADVKSVKRAVSLLSKKASVLAVRQLPQDLNYRTLAKLKNGEVSIVE